MELSSQLYWFGIFDGHGGSFTSRYLSAYLHQIYEFVTPDMVTDTVQFTRQHGGYFKRFNGGILERWVVKEHLKPVRGGGANAQSSRSEDSEQGQEASENQSNPSASSPTANTEPKPTPKLSAAAAAKAASTTSLPPWDDNDLTKRIPPPPGMENETLTLSERATLAFLVADRHILNRYPQPQGEFPLSSMHDPTSFPLLPHGNKGKGIATRPSDRGSGTEGGGGGSTATVCTLHSLDSPPQIWYDSDLLQLNVNHVGDTRLLLVPKSDGQAIPLTSKHHPDTSSESDRLRKLGAGIITDSFGESRWMGALANTRAFGDGKFKSFGVTSEPEIISQVIKSELYSCLILFSDGINEVMSDQEVIDLIRYSNHPQMASKEILKFAEELGVEDNATVTIVPLKGWGQSEYLPNSGRSQVCHTNDWNSLSPCSLVGGTDITKKQREYRKSKVDVFRDHRK